MLSAKMLHYLLILHNVAWRWKCSAVSLYNLLRAVSSCK